MRSIERRYSWCAKNHSYHYKLCLPEKRFICVQAACKRSQICLPLMALPDRSKAQSTMGTVLGIHTGPRQLQPLCRISMYKACMRCMYLYFFFGCAGPGMELRAQCAAGACSGGEAVPRARTQWQDQHEPQLRLGPAADRIST